MIIHQYEELAREMLAREKAGKGFPVLSLQD